MKLLGHLNLNNNQLQNSLLDYRTSLPTLVPAEEGKVLYLSTDHTIRYNNGTEWVTLASTTPPSQLSASGHTFILSADGSSGVLTMFDGGMGSWEIRNNDGMMELEAGSGRTIRALTQLELASGIHLMPVVNNTSNMGSATLMFANSYSTYFSFGTNLRLQQSANRVQWYDTASAHDLAYLDEVALTTHYHMALRTAATSYLTVTADDVNHSTTLTLTAVGAGDAVIGNNNGNLAITADTNIELYNETVLFDIAIRPESDGGSQIGTATRVIGSVYAYDVYFGADPTLALNVNGTSHRVQFNGNQLAYSSEVSNLSGTPSTTFQIDNDNGGPLLKNVGGNLEIRNATDTAYANITVNNLYVQGTTTQVNTETLTIYDNFLLLNSNNIGVGAPHQKAGIEVETGQTSGEDHRPHGALYYDSSVSTWYAGTITSTGSDGDITPLVPDRSKPIVRKATASLIDTDWTLSGGFYRYDFTHNLSLDGLNSNPVAVTIWEGTTMVFPHSVTVLSVDSIRIEVSAAPATATIVVIG